MIKVYPKTYLVYKATSPGGKVYIGITRQPLKRRIQQHLASAMRDAREGRHLRHFQNALLKYGSELSWEVLEDGLLFNEACELEKAYIREFRSNNSLHGYNGNEGGVTGRHGKSLDGDHRRNIQLSEASPVLRSDGRPFISGAAAAREMGASSKDAVSRSIRRGGSCAGFTFCRISLDAYYDALQAWGDRIQKGHVEQRPVWSKSRKGYKHTALARMNMSRSHVYSEQCEEKRLAAICKPVHRSDGKTYKSIIDAAVSNGMSRDQMSYVIRKGRVINGFVFGMEPLSEAQVERAIIRSVERMNNLSRTRSLNRSKPVLRSDGQVYPSATKAAEVLGLKAQDISYSLRSGKSRLGFTFTFHGPPNSFEGLVAK